MGACHHLALPPLVPTLRRPEAVVVAIPQDEMVGEGDAQGLAGGLEAAGELDVLPARAWVAAGMVMVGQGSGGAIP